MRPWKYDQRSLITQRSLVTQRSLITMMAAALVASMWLLAAPAVAQDTGPEGLPPEEAPGDQPGDVPADVPGEVPAADPEPAPVAPPVVRDAGVPVEAASAEHVDSATYGWATGSLEEQLAAASRQELPAGKGGIFVPKMTKDDEPQFEVRKGGQRVQTANPGERVEVAPGDYEVRIGSGAGVQAVKTSVSVVAGKTAVVPVGWGALRVSVVDEKLIPNRGSYEIINVDTRETFGVGFGADTLQGETLQVWLLPPGLYRIVQAGDTWRARINYFSVYVPAGAFVRFRLVVDEELATFLGGGVMQPDEFGEAEVEESAWSRYLVIGADGAFTQSSKVVGKVDQIVLSGDVYAEGYLGFNRDNHFATALFEVEGGWTQIRPDQQDALPIVKSKDRLRLDLLYTYFLTDFVGPYVRFAANTQLFETNVLATEDITVEKTLADGSVQTADIDTSESFDTSDAFAPTTLREGVGANFRLLNNSWAFLTWRAGVGLRQNIFSRTFVEDGITAADPAVLGSRPIHHYLEQESFNQEGLESTVRAILRVTRWLVYASDVEFFAPFDAFDKPIVEWANTLTLRITQYLSLNYSADLYYVPEIQDDVQFEHSILLRVSWAIF